VEPYFKQLQGDGVTYRVWDAPVRLMHWLNVAAVAVLFFTGFEIMGSVGRSNVDEPAFGFAMAEMRNLHYFAAVLMTINGAMRGYWFLASWQYRHWFRFNLWDLDFWRECWWKLKEYATLSYVGHEAHTLGHNALASLAYLFALAAATGLLLTGFAMRGQIDPTGWIHAAFSWVIPLLGSEANVRALHRFSMWCLLAFIIHHVAIVFYLDILGERGLASSMIIGLKIRPKAWKPVEKPWLESKP
jgi:Ni/Fe-hydrogenase 1 B-type cytochrome subunit